MKQLMLNATLDRTILECADVSQRSMLQNVYETDWHQGSLHVQSFYLTNMAVTQPLPARVPLAVRFKHTKAFDLQIRIVS